MKARHAAALFVLIAFFCGAQPASFNEIPFLPADTVQASYQPKKGEACLFIPSQFGKSEIGAMPALDSIRGFLVKEVLLVYSAFRRSDRFNQDGLNERRWENLLANYPEFFANGTTRFRNICQAGVSTDSAARLLSHGFYIYYENRADEEVRDSEISEVAKMLGALGIDTGSAGEPGPRERDAIEIPRKASERHGKFRKPMRTKDPKACRQPYYGEGPGDLSDYFSRHIVLSRRQKRKPKRLVAEVRLRLDFNGQIRSGSIMSKNKELTAQLKVALSGMDLWHPAVRNGITVRSDLRFTLVYAPEGHMKLSGGIVLPKYFARCGTAPDEELFDLSGKEPGDKLIPTVFEVPDKSLLRDVIAREPQLDSILLVVDLTGSMGPYIAQVLDLMAELVARDTPHVACISLFNDGNNKSDRRKEIGRTGGIIVLNNDITLDGLGKAILTSMKRGNGGDVMENNLEAAIRGLEQCSGCREIVMVADNFATPRDMELVSRIQKPIHWVLCGVWEEINVNYLDLARQSRGTLHTGRSVLRDLHLLGEGEKIVAEGYTYQLKNGRFRLLNAR